MILKIRAVSSESPQEFWNIFYDYLNSPGIVDIKNVMLFYFYTLITYMKAL